jgi:hypothetical protein
MNERRLFRPLMVVVGVALAAGCAPSIRSQRDENIPVPQGASWAWSSAETAPVRDSGAERRYIQPRYASGSFDAIVQQRFRRAIEAAMRGKGFRKADDPAQADFLVAFTFSGTEVARHPAVATTVGFAFSGGYYRPWGFSRPFGFSRPWGFYRPWGWYPWGWGLSFAPYPAYGYGSAYPVGSSYYRDGWLDVTLRLRSDGEVAWTGRYRTEERRVREMPQARVQEVVDKLLATLR